MTLTALRTWKLHTHADTQYMVYNPLLHRYYLTLEALHAYGLDPERRYISDNPDKIDELIEKTSKKVYDYINYKAGFSRYQIMMYRIATAPKTIYRKWVSVKTEKP